MIDNHMVSQYPLDKNIDCWEFDEDGNLYWNYKSIAEPTELAQFEYDYPRAYDFLCQFYDKGIRSAFELSLSEQIEVVQELLNDNPDLVTDVLILSEKIIFELLEISNFDQRRLLRQAEIIKSEIIRHAFNEARFYEMFEFMKKWREPYLD